MPASLAALMISVLGAAVTGLPSIVKFIRSPIFSFWFLVSSFSLVLSQREFLRVGARISVQVCFEVLRELFHDRDGGHGGGIAQSAECAAQHVLRKLVDQRDVALSAHSIVEPLQHLFEPGGSFTARDA